MTGLAHGRHSRQELFAGIGRDGQARLRAARVLVAFGDGRAIVKGARDVVQARCLYAKHVGA